MKLVDNRNGIEVYDLENGYQVAKEKCPWIPRGYMLSFYTGYSGKGRQYLPDIYDHIDCRSSMDNESEWAFRIQTVSYGSLHPDEIEKIISGYQTALETIQLVKEAFGGKKEMQ